MPGLRHGHVAAFDEGKGWGWVQADDGEALFFHCTGLADGSRSVAVGARVAFSTRAGDHGRWEAWDVVGAGRT